MKARCTVDPRRTLTPDGSVIAVAPEGFSLSRDRDVIFRLRWDQVHQIAAYTRFRALKPEICLAFAFSRRQTDQIVVHDRVQGWDDLCATIPVAFASADPDWRAKAAHDGAIPEAYAAVASVVPVFTINPTIVWTK